MALWRARSLTALLLLAVCLAARPTLAQSPIDHAIAPKGADKADKVVPFSFHAIDDSSRKQRLPFNAQRLVDWTNCAWAHEPGSFDAAAQHVTGWHHDYLAALLVDLEQTIAAIKKMPQAGRPLTSIRDWKGSRNDLVGLLGLTPDEAWGDGITRLLQRAVVLHTDVAVSIGDAIFSVDGAREMSQTSLHAGFALALTGALDKEGAAPGFVLDWYRAVTAFLQKKREVTSAPVLLARALRRYPDDVFLLVSDGLTHELLAAPFAQDEDLFAGNSAKPAVESAGSHLRKAEHAYREALRFQPEAAEVRMRLGRVLYRLERPADAAAELRAVRPPDGDQFVAYLAPLFLGDAEAAAGHGDLAREAYQRALVTAPHAQSCWLSISRLAQRSGDRDRAIEAMRMTLESHVDADTGDPWSQYYRGQGGESDARLNRLRDAVRGKR